MLPGGGRPFLDYLQVREKFNIDHVLIVQSLVTVRIGHERSGVNHAFTVHHLIFLGLRFCDDGVLFGVADNVVRF